jgi:hypothetical protein
MQSDILWSGGRQLVMIEFSLSLSLSLFLFILLFFLLAMCLKCRYLLAIFWDYFYGINGLKWIPNCEAVEPIYQSFVILIECING